MLEQRTHKNYKELCKAMNWKVTSSDSKNKQFKELDPLYKSLLINDVHSKKNMKTNILKLLKKIMKKLLSY